MLGFLIALLVVCVVVYVIRLLLPLLGLPEPINTAIMVIVALLALLWLLSGLGVMPAWAPLRIH